MNTYTITSPDGKVYSADARFYFDSGMAFRTTNAIGGLLIIEDWEFDSYTIVTHE